MLNFSQKYFFVTLIVVAMLATFWSGVEWSRSHDKATSTSVSVNSAEVDLDPFWKAWGIINERFVDTSGTSTKIVTDQEKVWGAIDGLVGSLGDPYSDFMPPRDNKVFNQDISGSFGGIGTEIGMRNDVLTVISPLEGSPAKRAGIKSGDKIIKINDTDLFGLSINESIDLIRGEVGTMVRVTVMRDGEKSPLEFKITREVINVPTLETKLLPEDIFQIKLFNFGATAPQLFRQALIDFIASGTDKLIIDLRGNPGGYLDAAVSIGSWFLPKGSIIAIEDHAGRAENREYKSSGYDVFNDQLKLVVLIDGGSASASEILAGALADHGVAKLVGEKSFGKGSVQELIPITSDTSLKLTIARWMTPKGVSISHQGITPDVVVKLPKEEAKEDLILKQAVKVLLNWK